ncbi:MAG: hypothetical protein IPJ03_03440 [Ignavibacteriales bacterium]|nr:hypothetical protein [Ignavibacteriales bacterium]
MKTLISIRMLVLGFFLISIFIVTSDGCGNKETPDKQQTQGKSLTFKNYSPTLQVDTTALQKEAFLPSSASDSLLKRFRFFAKGVNNDLLKEYPIGYGILTLNNGRYTSIALSNDERLVINWKQSKINPMGDKGMGIQLNGIKMENFNFLGFTVPFNLDYTQKETELVSTSLKLYTQLLLKTEAGMMVLVGFKEK